jgi:hypothetical protein
MDWQERGTCIGEGFVSVGGVAVDLLVITCFLHLLVCEPEFWREEVLGEAVRGFANVELESCTRVVGVHADMAVALGVGIVLVWASD